MREWFSIQLKSSTPHRTDPDRADVTIFDAIGSDYDGVAARDLVARLQSLPAAVKTIVVHVSSPGGSVFEAIAVADAIRAQRAAGKTVEAVIYGVTASAATLITSACDPITCSRDALLMIHEPTALDYGSAADHRRTADLLEKVRGRIVDIYSRIVTVSKETLARMIADETWLTSEEALEVGLVTRISEALTPFTNTWSPSGLRVMNAMTARVPADKRDRVAALLRPVSPPAAVQPADAARVVALVHASQLPASLAHELIDAKAPITEVEARIDVVRTITKLARTAGVPQSLADVMINERISVEGARKILVCAGAMRDEAARRIDGTVPAGNIGASGAAGKINIGEVYDAMNANHFAHKTTGAR